MKRRPSLPADPFGRVLSTRADRVRALAQTAEALAEGRQPDPAHAAWLGRSIQAWLLAQTPAKATRLDGPDFLDAAAPERSAITPQKLLRSILSGTSEGLDE